MKDPYKIDFLSFQKEIELNNSLIKERKLKKVLAKQHRRYRTIPRQIHK